MSSIVTLRPNGLAYAGTGYWKRDSNVTIGGGDWAYQQDNNDGTFFYGIMSTVDEFHLHFGSITLAANQRCARARLGHRIRGTSPTFPMGLDTYMSVPGYLGDGSIANHTGVFANWTQLWNPWHEAEFTSAAIGAIQGKYRKLDNTTTPSVSESYVELDIRTQPTVSITSPAAGSIAYTRRPTVTWSYNAQGDAVRAHQVRVFSAAQVGVGGFNPATSAATWDSGRVGGAATSKTVGVDLARGTTYYFYVRLASDFRGTDWWSNWASRHVVINTLPVASAVTVTPATPITTTNRPTIGWTFSDANGNPQNQYWVRVYSEAVYGAPGFNESDVASAAWSSGAVTSSAARSAQTGVLSPNVNYKAYVWVNDLEGAWSPSAQSGVFTIQTAPGTMSDPPAAPEVVSAAADDANQRVVVAVAGRDNLLTRNQSTIDTGITGWEADTNIIGGGITRNTTTFLQGGGALSFFSSGAGSTKVRTVGTQQMPVAANRVYTALASMRTGTLARTGRVLIGWRDAAGALVSTTTGATQAINNAGWTQLVATAAAPEGAAYAQLFLEVTDASGGEEFIADNLGLAPGDDATWYRGGFVVEAGTVADSFNRADNASSLGTADEGGAWTTQLGTWGINGNRAYRTDLLASPADAFVVLSSSHVADGYVEADIALSAGQALGGLVFRNLDINNTLMVRLWKSATRDDVELYKRDAGTWTQLAIVTGAGLVLGQTYRLRVEFYGGQINVYLDGDLRIGHLLLAGEHTKYGAYGNYGLYANTAASADDGGTRWDNFRAALDPTQLVTVERSLDDGATWYPLRGAVRYDLGPTQQATFYDYEVSAGLLAQYRATAYASEAGEEYASAVSPAAVQDTPLVIDRWWLKDAVDPSLNMPITVSPPFQFRRKEPMSAYEPMGRTEAVFVSDGAKGVEGQLNIWCKDEATWDKLQAILGNGRALLLQNPLGHNWWVKFGDQEYQLIRSQSELGSTTPVRHFHAVALPFVQVSAPAVV